MTGIHVILPSLTFTTKISLHYISNANSKRYYLYLLSMKGKQHMWGELEGEKSKWALRKLAERLSMRQPRFKGTQIVLTAILPTNKRPTMRSGREQASLVKQWGRKYITYYIKCISAENNEAERIRWESHRANALLANSTWQKVKRITPHAPTSSESPPLAVVERWWLLSVKPMHFRMDFDVISSFTEADL